VVIVAFLFLTAPVAAHAIGRAGYRRKSPLWKGTIADELADADRGRKESA
jgi:multicomponent Na+:H+ antiporter subunit G